MSSSKIYQIKVDEPLDISKIERLQKQIFKALDSGINKLSFNLENLNYIDSSGIALLVRVLRRITHMRDGSLFLEKVRPQVYKILQIAALEKIVRPGELIIEKYPELADSSLLCSEDVLRESFTERLQIKCSPGELWSMREFLKEKIFNFGFSEKLSYDILVAVTEACSNSIEHSGCGPDQHMDIVFSYSNGKFTAELKDYGSGFEHERIALKKSRICL